MTFRIKDQEYSYLLAAALFSIVIVIPIIFIGIPDTIDLPQHFRFADAYYSSIINGDWFPGWAGNENFGYGDIGIRFYPPLAYYFLAFGRLLTGNWYDATWLTFVFWMLAGSAGIYYWSRIWFSVKESSFIAVIYVLIPFHLNQLYTGFNQFSELAATSLLTVCFAFLSRVIRDGKLPHIIGLSASYALLMITHLPTAIVGSISLFILFIVSVRKQRIGKQLLHCGIAITVSVLATSFYWVRLISEMKWLNHEDERYTKGYFDFAGNLFPLTYHIVNKPTYIYSILDLIVSFTMLAFISAIVYKIYKRSDPDITEFSRSVFTTVIPVGLFAFFMFTPLSKPLWQIVTPLQKIQFPIRWMPIAAICGAVTFGASVIYLKKSGIFKKRIWFHSFLIFSLTVLLFDFTYILHPSSYIPLQREKFESKIEDLPKSQSFFYWWTVWSAQEALSTKQNLSTDERGANITSWQREEKSFTIAPGKPQRVRVAVFYYPFWNAEVNGEKIEIEKDESGAILVPVPAGESRVSLTFREPLKNRIAEYVSVFSWILLLFGICIAAVKFNFRGLRSLK